MKALSSMKPVIPDWGRVYPQLRRYLAGVYGKAWEKRRPLYDYAHS